MSTTFNYKTKNYHEAVGLSSDDLDSLGEKLSSKSIKILKESSSPGTVAEWVANNISYKELLFMAVKQIFEKLEESVSIYNEMRDEHMPPEIKDLMEFLNKHSDGVTTNPETGATIHAIRLDGSESSSDVPKKLLKFLKALTGEKEEKTTEHKGQPKSFEDLKEEIRKKKEADKKSGEDGKE